jgi:predicted CXXCH cytochrome family protein
MKATHFGALRTMGLVAALTLSASCVNDKIVYRETPNFTEPPAAAASYVGYSNTANKQTTCGNCHVDWQTKWIGTKHADAWKDLQASGHASDACIACHTVSSKGNADTTSAVGYTGSKDERYYDVQCENCHGKGLSHISSPKSTNRPLATIAVDTGSLNVTGCGECHTGTHEPFVDEWRGSLHGSVESHTVGNASCNSCHNGQGALAAWGVNSNFVEKGKNDQPITCAVCHDPHAKNNDKQLRFAVDVPDTSQNLCMKCHQRRSTLDISKQSSGPHSPEGPTLLGIAGWWPNGITDTLIATHVTDRNPKLCAGCHVNRFTVTDPKTGAFAFQATGHRFEAIPCLDASGKPTSGPCDISARTFKACTGSGCHGTEQVARSAMIAAEARIDLLTAELNAQLAKVATTEFKQDATVTVAEGAKFNAGLGAKAGVAIHNPFLMEALLITSINAVQTTYGIAPNAGLNLNKTLPQLKLK